MIKFNLKDDFKLIMLCTIVFLCCLIKYYIPSLTNVQFLFLLLHVGIILFAREDELIPIIMFNHTCSALYDDIGFKYIFNLTILIAIIKILINIKLYSLPYVRNSNLAGIAMFGKSNFKIINNAIDYNKYMYSELHRKKLRTQYHIEENEKVIGYVGRFSPQKNIFFFIELAKKIDSSYKIMMIGKGSLKEEFISLINENSLADKFVLIDEISNVNEYYSMFD